MRWMAIPQGPTQGHKIYWALAANWQPPACTRQSLLQEGQCCKGILSRQSKLPFSGRGQHSATSALPARVQGAPQQRHAEGKMGEQRPQSMIRAYPKIEGSRWQSSKRLSHLNQEHQEQWDFLQPFSRYKTGQARLWSIYFLVACVINLYLQNNSLGLGCTLFIPDWMNWTCAYNNWTNHFNLINTMLPGWLNKWAGDK